MTSQTIVINALDTLMFRDGRPFNQNDRGASTARSVFPPYPPTIVGAIRATLWKQSGGPFDTKSLGNGTHWYDSDTELGKLNFSAPVLQRKGEFLFNLPLNIVKCIVDNQTQLTTLAPDTTALSCDLNADMRLPYSRFQGVKPLSKYWVDCDQMTRVLSGKLPAYSDLIDEIDLWENETHVGIGIENSTRLVKKSQLYMATHARTDDNISIAVSVDGLPAQIHSALRPIGGEHRMAEIAMGPKLDMPRAPNSLENGRYYAALLSPMVIDRLPEFGEDWSELPGKLVSACLGKPVSIGGWDSLNRRPIPLRRTVPAGSVWFMQDADDAKALEKHLSHIGLSTEWGFGQILIGTW